MPAYAVSGAEAIHQLGQTAYRRLHDLQDWLYGPGCPELEFRLAPSLITRCEAELFGVSSPRFALRTHFPDGSVVNARRLAAFARNVSRVRVGSVGHAALPAGYHAVRLTKEVLDEWIVQPGQCVADSLLKRPERFRDFRVLEADIGRAYGDRIAAACGDGAPSSGTPFLQHIATAGGMCGHAAAFMASVLMEPAIKFIYGLSEISAVAQGVVEGERSAALDLSDMDLENLLEFFNQEAMVGLQAFNQFADWNHRGIPREFASAAIRGYLASGMPLILAVDLGRMWGDLLPNPGDSIVARARLPLRRRPPARFRKGPHSVVLVGYHPSRDEYLLNDPATYPFLAATLDDLDRVRRYDKEGSEWAELASPQEPLTFLSVTPRQVTLPLLDTYLERIYYFGLLQCARSAQTYGHMNAGPLPRYEATRYRPGEWRLVDFRGPEHLVRAGLDHLPPEGIDRVLSALQDRRLPRTWHWVQYLPSPPDRGEALESIWLWDAEHYPTSVLRDCDRFLTAVFAKEGLQAWRIAREPGHRYPPPAAAPASPPSSGIGRNYRRHVQASLISSFCPGGNPAPAPDPACPYHAAHPVYGGAVDAVPAEAYTLMEHEVRRWIVQWAGPEDDRAATWAGEANDLNAIEFLSKLEPSETTQVAERLDREFSAYGSKIIAIASFIPEIGQGTAPPRDTAVGAVRALIRLARCLQQLGHETHTVELVAGSRIQSVQVAQAGPGGDPMLRFRMASRADALLQLIENLKELAEDLAPDEYYVNLALELEPGAHFSLRNWPTVVEFCTRLQDEPALRRRVGLNLDIAHWRLAQITDSVVRRTPSVWRRIAHAHIAGHHRCAHFGDTCLLDCNQREEFLPWLDLLRDIARTKRKEAAGGPIDYPEFSGYVSVEIEAVRDDCVAARSFLHAKQLGL